MPDSGSSALHVPIATSGSFVHVSSCTVGPSRCVRFRKDTTGVDGGVLSETRPPPETAAVVVGPWRKLTEYVVRPTPVKPAPPRTPTSSVFVVVDAALRFGVNL